MPNVFLVILSNTNFAMYFQWICSFAKANSSLCLKDHFTLNPCNDQVFLSQAELSHFQYPNTATVKTVMSVSPTVPWPHGKERLWKPCTNLFLRSIPLLFSDRFLLFGWEPYSKQGQVPLVSLVLSLPKELYAYTENTDVSSATKIHCA